MKHTIEKMHEDIFLLSQVHLDQFSMIGICSWHSVSSFSVCHWLLRGPTCETFGFDCIRGRPHKAIAAKCSYGKGPSGPAFPWSMSSFWVWGWTGHFIFEIYVDFTWWVCAAQPKKDVKGCRENQKPRAQMHCKEKLLWAVVTVF